MNLETRNDAKRTRARSGRSRPHKRQRRASNNTGTQLKETKHTSEANSNIPRSSLFYSGSFVPKVGLPSTHILNQRPSNSRLLLLALLGGKTGRKQWRRVRELGLPLCQQILQRHASCDYHRALNRYCPLPDFCRGPANPEPSSSNLGESGITERRESSPVSLPQVSAGYTDSDGVLSFLRAVLRHVFPPSFWGSEGNYQNVLQVVDTFVNLRRQEHLPTKYLMIGLRVKNLVWVYGGSEVNSWSNATSGKHRWPKSLHEAATARARNVMKWLFVDFIIPLLRSVFYITESEFSAKRVLYFRKPVWSIFRSLSMKKLTVRQYKEISSDEAASLVRNQRMGFSKLRLLPKKSGVRALALLSKREFPSMEANGGVGSEYVENSNDFAEAGRVPPLAKKAKLKEHTTVHQRTMNPKFSSTNAVLRNVYDVLSYERGRHPELFGSGVFGLNEVFPKYLRFVDAFRALKASSCGSAAKLYFASVDIQQCYDSIVQEHLLGILPDLITEDEYLIQNSAVIHPFQSMGRVIKKPIKRIGAPEAYSSFRDAVESMVCDYSRSVFLDNGGSSLLHKENAMALLQEHLMSHIVVIRGHYGDRFLLQTSGIPQGSILSMLLCNYYYGDVERALLGSLVGDTPDNAPSFVLKKDDATLLLRIVDDFLLITTSRDLSHEFLTVMNAGREELGVRTNKDKTLVSYPVQLEGSDGELPRPNQETGEDRQARFPWCGMLFDTESGETSVDYTRFADRKAIDALTVDRSGAEGRQLEVRMKTFVRPRCQPILFDRRINSERTVCINFCQVFLLCAVKAHSYIHGMEGGIQRNAAFIARSIDDVISYAHKLIADRIRLKESTVSSVGQLQSSPLPLTARDAMWLGRKAFLSIFRKANGCNGVGALLGLKCESPMPHPLQDVVDESIRLFNAQVGGI